MIVRPSKATSSCSVSRSRSHSELLLKFARDEDPAQTPLMGLWLEEVSQHHGVSVFGPIYKYGYEHPTLLQGVYESWGPCWLCRNPLGSMDDLKIAYNQFAFFIIRMTLLLLSSKLSFQHPL